MQFTDHPERLKVGAENFNSRTGRQDGAVVVGSLSAGLTRLRDLLFTRVHYDFERDVGMDSMLMPVSELKTQTACRIQIEFYQIPVAGEEAVQQGYVDDADGWYIPWLAELRLGQPHPSQAADERIEAYLAKIPSDRRLAFTDVMARVCPESRRAPLVLFRLFPLSVRMATAIAYGDSDRVRDLRKQQARLLPAIADCIECHGQVLDNGEVCHECGNPVWKYRWLICD
jgi:hypothetical protein